MVAGATGIDLVLLVIAADDGVMPQTVEHLAIIELLGVRDGVVVLTKSDLVDDELLEHVEADVARVLGDDADSGLRAGHRERPGRARPRGAAGRVERLRAPRPAERRAGPSAPRRVFP